jgi:hypothetical protein
VQERQVQMQQAAEDGPSHFPPSRELRIVTQNTINVNLEHALSLSIILAREETYPWFYENYVQLFSIHLFRRYTAGLTQIVPQDELRGDERAEIILQFALRPGSFWLREVYAKKFLRSDPEHIIQFIVESINEECYVRIEVDEYDLPNKRRYKRQHFIHPALVYGYDYATKTLLALGFDSKTVFTKLTFGYDDFSRAYASARALAQSDSSTRKKPLVGLIKMRNVRARYPFSLERFLKELEGYLFSSMDSARKYDLVNFLSPEANVDAMVKFGFSVYEDFEAGLRQLLLGNALMDYKNIHVLYEHKRVLMEALKFIIFHYQVKGRLVSLVDDFQRVVQQFHSMRWKYIRYTVTKNTQLIEQIIGQIGTAKKDEHELLMHIHEQLHQIAGASVPATI